MKQVLVGRPVVRRDKVSVDGNSSRDRRPLQVWWYISAPVGTWMPVRTSPSWCWVNGRRSFYKPGRRKRMLSGQPSNQQWTWWRCRRRTRIKQPICYNIWNLDAIRVTWTGTPRNMSSWWGSTRLLTIFYSVTHFKNLKFFGIQPKLRPISVWMFQNNAMDMRISWFIPISTMVYFQPSKLKLVWGWNLENRFLRKNSK